MQSNKLILQVDRRSMGGEYLQGITEINANSLLVNELVVKIGTWTTDGEKQTFKQGKLLAGETLWVDFEKNGTKLTKSMLFVEREETQLTATAEVDGVTITEIPNEKQYEYYLTLPQVIMQNAGTWDFSLSIKHVAAINVQGINELQYMGEWNAGTGAVQTVRTPTKGDFYHCTGVGYYNPDGTRNPTQYQIGEQAVYNGATWVGSSNLFAFDYIKSSSVNTPYNLTVNNSLTMAGTDKPITEADVSAFLEMAGMLEQGAQFNIPICCICAKTLDRAPSTATTNNQTIDADLVKAGVPVVNQYALCTNGIVQINAINETTGEISGTVKSAYRIKLNDKASSEQVFFAPSTSGEDGQVLTSLADGEPVWRNLKINNYAFTGNKAIYAPTTGGTAGQVLFSGGDGQTPTWGDVPTGGGGGSSADGGEIQFCCISTNSSGVRRGNTGACHISTVIAGEPVVGGRVLLQNGSGLITSINTNNNYVMYTVEQVTLITLNGEAETPSNTSFFAPTSAGSSGYILKSNGFGEPSWVSPDTIGGGSGNQYTFTVTDRDDESTTFVFTLFGDLTFEDTSGTWNDYSLLQFALRHNVGYNKIIPASGEYGGGEAVWGIKQVNYSTTIIYTVGGQYELPTTAQFTYYTQPLNKNFQIAE